MTDPTVGDRRLDVELNRGSFRDPQNRVYDGDGVVLRGLSQPALDTYHKLANQNFFRECLENRQVVATKELRPKEWREAGKIFDDGWAGVLHHEKVPFVSYPYEWTFSMLKDAALLHLSLIETSFENGWSLKDATPYNVQWFGSRPAFIDIPSFEPWLDGEPWIGYRQFCSMFLIPLMLKAYAGIDYIPLIRSRIDGIGPAEAVRYFKGLNRYKRGVLAHVSFPAFIENQVAKRQLRAATPRKRRSAPKHSKAMVIGLVQSLARLVNKLKSGVDRSGWAQYDKTHSYEEADYAAKKTFVERHVSSSKWPLIWDIGCNTGTFSRLCSGYSNYIVAVDGDHDAVEQLYLSEKSKDESNILPLVMDFSNISPNQGWAGQERAAFDSRARPDLVLCLALVHHLRISANIPISHIMHWLRSLSASILFEFVNRSDEMVEQLLSNKREKYDDYNLESFVSAAEEHFEIRDRQAVKGGHRELFFLTPK